MTATDGRILVGLDGSERGRSAARWATEWAEQLGAPLDLVAVLPEMARGGMAAVQYSETLKALDADMTEHVRSVKEEIVEARPDIEVAELVEYGMPAPTLVRLSESARGMVIGTRGLRGFRAMALGAVADHVVTHAHGRVVVVPGTAELESPGPVFVGVDGSPESLRALSVAAEEADRRGRPLHVLSVWDGAGLVPLANLVAHQRGELRDLDPSEGRIAEAIAAEQAAHPDLVVERIIDQGRASELLVRASRRASLLVVASRGRGAFPGMVLGSTSRAVAQHSECPVLVVRD